jgi:hypothetical protein
MQGDADNRRSDDRHLHVALLNSLIVWAASRLGLLGCGSILEQAQHLPFVFAE